MKKKMPILLILMLCLIVELKAQRQETLRSDDHFAGQILFQLVDNQSVEKIENIFGSEKRQQFKIEEIAPTMHIYCLTFDPAETDENRLLNRLRTTPSVLTAQFNHQIKLRGTPNDPLFKEQWNLQKVNAPSVWDVTTGGLTACGDTIVVAVIDGGFKSDVSDLRENVWVNKGEIPNNGIDDDKNGYVDDYLGLNTSTKRDNHTTNITSESIRHGTACAGIIGASGNNNKLMTGVNWKIKLMLLSGVLVTGNGEMGIVRAYDYVIYQRRLYDSTGGKKGAFIPITSMSVGYDGYTPSAFPLLCNVYETLNKMAILNFVSATNKREDALIAGDIPSLCNKEGLIMVTATDSSDKIDAGFSTKYIHLTAPGKNIRSLTPEEETDTDDGTSFATPLVAGAAALLWSMPELGLCQLSKSKPLEAMNRVKNAILKGVDKVPGLELRTITGGRLNIKQSFDLLRRSFGVPIGDWAILKMYPNPVSSKLKIELQFPEKIEPDILIFNTLGQIVYQKRLSGKDLSAPLFVVDVENFEAGVYFLSLKLDGGFQKTQKFVVVHK